MDHTIEGTYMVTQGTHRYLLEAVGHGQDGDTHNAVAKINHWANG